MMGKPIIVSGALANKPLNSGAAWTRLNWLLGFQRLGFQVYFLEQIEPDHCVTKLGKPEAFETSCNLLYFKRVMQDFGLENSSALILGQGRNFFGMGKGQILEIASNAQCLINISGHLRWEPAFKLIPKRLYLDLDPGFTQFWHLKGYDLRLPDHDLHFTVGENIGSDQCSIPAAGLHWQHIRQPVVLEEWPTHAYSDPFRFTTVAAWRGPYDPVEFGGQLFGVKAHEFRQIVQLPQLVGASFELALDIDSSEACDLKLLQENRWSLVDPRRELPNPATFRNYVQSSAAEFSVAKGVYVHTRSGWFSDRSVRYLASGKPVLVQDTGLGSNYPIGQGLLVFRGLSDAVKGALKVLKDYSAHSQTAREMAEVYFDSRKVLGELADRANLSP